MSDASTSLDEDMDNNIDEEEDSMNTSSDEIGSSLNRLEDDGSDIASTSTNDHHGSDKDIDDANGDETSTNSGVSDTDMADANGEEVENDNDSTNKSLLSGESSSQDDYSSDDEEGREEMLEMFIVETCKFEEMSNLLEGLISRELIKSNQYDSFATAFEALGFARSKRVVLRHNMFYHIDEEKFEELERLGKEKGMESFINVAIKLGYEDQLKTWPKISGYMGTSDNAAAGNNNNIGDGSSSRGGDGGSSIQHQQQHNMRRTSLEQEEDEDGATAHSQQMRKRDRSPRSSSSSSSDINRLTKHCSSSSSDGESDQGRRRLRRRRRLNNGTESPRQESEGDGALALENARLRKKVEMLEKKKDSVATMKASLEKKQQELAKGKELLNKKIAEEEARILSLKEDAKAESDQLAKEREALEQEQADHSIVLKRRAKEKKDRLAAERLSIEHDKIRSLFDSLDTHPIAVGSLREVEAVACRLEAAFNPQAPNLSLIPEITRDLLAIHQNIAKYKKLITNHVTVQQTKDKDPLIDISLNDGIGTILSNIAKNVAARDKALNHIVSPELLDLMAALQRFQTGKECDTPVELSSTDINMLRRDLLKSDQGVANLVLNCVHLTLMVWVESELSIEQLYLHLDERHLFLRRATELHNQVRRGELFDPKMSLCRFREEAIIPALNGNDEQLQQLATQVGQDFANNLTLSGSDERKDIIQPVLQLVEKKKFDGSSNDVQDDGSSSDVQDGRYFSEPGNQHNTRRKSVTCLLFNASASRLIEKRLPEQVPDGDSIDLFPDGYLRALLVNSSTFCKEYCNFISPNRGLFKEGHDLKQTAKTIYKKMKSHDITEEKTVIVGIAEKDSLKRLFGM